MGHVLFIDKGSRPLGKSSGKSIHDLLILGDTAYPALRVAGLTEGEEQALEDDPRLGVVAVNAIRQAIRLALEADEAAIRREKLDLNIYEEQLLEKREANVLRRHGIYTLGDLVMRTRHEVMWYRGIGGKAREHVDKLLADYGLQPLDDRGNFLEYAIYLYGGGEYIPSRHLCLWSHRLDGETKEYLLGFETLGRLVETDAQDFLDAHLATQPKPISRSKQQLVLLRTALERAGLHFRGE